MLNFSHGLAVHRLMSRVAYSSKFMLGSLVGCFNSLKSIVIQSQLEKVKNYLLSVVEVSSMFKISLLSRAFSNLESTEVVFTEVSSIRSLELFLGRRVDSGNVLTVNSSSRSFSERLSVNVLRLNLRNVTGISRNVLSFNIVSGTTEPVITMLGVVSKLKGIVEFISSRSIRVKLSLSERRLANSNIDIIVTGLVSSLSNNLVDITSSTSIDVILLGNVTSVAW